MRAARSEYVGRGNRDASSRVPQPHCRVQVSTWLRFSFRRARGLPVAENEEKLMTAIGGQARVTANNVAAPDGVVPEYLSRESPAPLIEVAKSSAMVAEVAFVITSVAFRVS